MWKAWSNWRRWTRGRAPQPRNCCKANGRDGFGEPFDALGAFDAFGASSVVAGLISGVYVESSVFARLYAGRKLEKVSWKKFALLLPAYAALVLVARPVSGMIQDKFGDNVLFVPGIAFQMVGLLGIALAPSLLTVLLCAVGCALGYGMLSTCCNAIVVRNVSTERRSYAVSTFWMFSDGGMGLGPFIMGAFASLGGYSTMLIAAAVFTLAAFPVYAVSHWKDGKHPGVQR